MIEVHQVSEAEWRPMIRDARLAVFGEVANPNDERIDFALVAVDGPELLSYVNCREFDARTLYWGFGGSFPPAKNTMRSWQVYTRFTEHCWAKGYTRIFTLIENTNKVMLKFAAKLGYIIVGIRTINGSVMLDHQLDVPRAA